MVLTNMRLNQLPLRLFFLAASAAAQSPDPRNIDTGSVIPGETTPATKPLPARLRLFGSIGKFVRQGQRGMPMTHMLPHLGRHYRLTGVFGNIVKEILA